MTLRFMWFAFLGLLALEVGAAAIQTRTAMFTAPPAISQKSYSLDNRGEVPVEVDWDGLLRSGDGPGWESNPGPIGWADHFRVLYGKVVCYRGGGRRRREEEEESCVVDGYTTEFSIETRREQVIFKLEPGVTYRVQVFAFGASSSGTVTAVQSPSVDFTPKSCDGVTPYVGEKPKVELLNSERKIRVSLDGITHRVCAESAGVSYRLELPGRNNTALPESSDENSGPWISVLNKDSSLDSVDVALDSPGRYSVRFGGIYVKKGTYEKRWIPQGNHYGPAVVDVP